MKKWIATAILLALLFMWIADEHLPHWRSQDSLHADQPPTASSWPEAIPAEPSIIQESSTPFGLDESPDDLPDQYSIVRAADGHSSRPPRDWSALTPIPEIPGTDSILYLRSTKILSGDESSLEEIERLRRTVSLLEETDPRERIILDADAVGANDVPFVLYAKEDLDVTSHVLRVFERFLEYEDLIENEEVEQGGGGSTPISRRVELDSSDAVGPD